MTMPSDETVGYLNCQGCRNRQAEVREARERVRALEEENAILRADYGGMERAWTEVRDDEACVTHHYACACREAAHNEARTDRDALLKAIEEAERRESIAAREHLFAMAHAIQERSRA